MPGAGSARAAISSARPRNASGISGHQRIRLEREGGAQPEGEGDQMRVIARVASGWRPSGWKRRAADPPHLVADIVRHQQAAVLADLHPDRAAIGDIADAEAAQDRDRLGARRGHRPGEGDEHHFIAAGRLAVPRSMLADEGAAGELRAERLAGGEGQAERGDVRPERIIGRDRLGDHRGLAGGRLSTCWP